MPDYKGYRPDSASPESFEDFRYYVNRELRNIAAAFDSFVDNDTASCCPEGVTEVTCDEWLAITNPEKNDAYVLSEACSNCEQTLSLSATSDTVLTDLFNTPELTTGRLGHRRLESGIVAAGNVVVCPIYDNVGTSGYGDSYIYSSDGVTFQLGTLPTDTVLDTEDPGYDATEQRMLSLDRTSGGTIYATVNCRLTAGNENSLFSSVDGAGWTLEETGWWDATDIDSRDLTVAMGQPLAGDMSVGGGTPYMVSQQRFSGTGDANVVGEPNGRYTSLTEADVTYLGACVLRATNNYLFVMRENTGNDSSNWVWRISQTELGTNEQEWSWNGTFWQLDSDPTFTGWINEDGTGQPGRRDMPRFFEARNVMAAKPVGDYVLVSHVDYNDSLEPLGYGQIWKIDGGSPDRTAEKLDYTGLYTAPTGFNVPTPTSSLNLGFDKGRGLFYLIVPLVKTAAPTDVNWGIRWSLTGDPSDWTDWFVLDVSAVLSAASEYVDIAWSDTQDQWFVNANDGTNDTYILAFDDPTVLTSASSECVTLQPGEAVKWDGMQWVSLGLWSVNHEHVEADITDLDKYTQAQVDSAISSAVSTHEAAGDPHPQYGFGDGNVIAGYASMELNTPTAITIPTDSTWVTVPFDTQPLAAEVNAVSNLTNESIRPDLSGVWRMAFSMYLEYDSSATVRTLNWRWRNTTEGTVGPTNPVYVPVNQTGLNFAVDWLMDVPVSGQEFVIELGGTTSSFTSPQIENAEYNANRISEGVVDPDFDLVEALLHFNGPDTSIVFRDETGKTWTASGNAQIDTAQSKFGGAAGLFDGTGDYVTEGGAAGAWNFLHNGAQSYTIEIQVRPNVLNGGVVFGTGGAASANRGVALQLNANGSVDWYVAKGTGGSYAARITSAASVVSTGSWYQIAIKYDQPTGQYEMLVEGTSEGTDLATSPSASNHTTALTLGRYTSGASLHYNGHMDEFRITKKVRTEALPQAAEFPDVGP